MSDSEYSSLKIYMNDIAKFKLLNKEEEKELAALICQGSQEALKKLIESNLRLVVKIAHDYKRGGRLGVLPVP